MLSISTTSHLHHHHSSFAFRPKNSIPFRTPKTQFSLHHASLPDPTKDEGENVGESLSPSAAAALAAAIRLASPASPVKFTQKVEKQGKAGLILPSPDFQRICIEQLDLFRMVVHRDAVLSVFVRPAGSYVMDRLELRRVTFYPGIGVSENTDCVILVGNFAVSAGLRSAEAALSKQQVEFLSEYGAVILPMVKHPFVVGFLVAELPNLETEIHENAQSGEQYLPFCSMKDGSPGLPPCSDKKLWEIQTFKEDPNRNYAQLTHDQKSRAMMISRSLAMAYVMDQKAMLLQQSSWQNNVRMSHLVEQIHSSISSIRALSKMLSVHVKKSEISLDIIEDILMQGDHMKDTLQQLQIYAQKNSSELPKYDTVRESYAHALHFKASVTVDGQTYYSPQFLNTLKEAENDAAKVALSSLSLDEKPQDKSYSYKNMLQVLMTKEGLSMPKYKTTSNGASHMPIFSSTIEIGSRSFMGDVAKSKKQAEMNAVKVACANYKLKEQFLLMMFVTGLKREIGYNVQALKPKTLAGAIDLALIQDKNLQGKHINLGDAAIDQQPARQNKANALNIVMTRFENPSAYKDKVNATGLPASTNAAIGQPLDLISVIEELSGFSSKEISRLLKNSENFTVQCNTGRGSSARQRIGLAAYQLSLPPGARTHPVFHVSQLKKKLGEEVQVQTHMPSYSIEIVKEPEMILERRMVRRQDKAVSEILVKWKNLPAEESTWENYWDLARKFPGFDLGTRPKSRAEN